MDFEPVRRNKGVTWHYRGVTGSAEWRMSDGYRLVVVWVGQVEIEQACHPKMALILGGGSTRWV
jgi:hypothetical protein